MVQPDSRLVIVQTQGEHTGKAAKSTRPAQPSSSTTPTPQQQLHPLPSIQAAAVNKSAPTRKKAVTRSVSFAARRVELNSSSSDDEEKQIGAEGLYPLGQTGAEGLHPLGQTGAEGLYPLGQTGAEGLYPLGWLPSHGPQSAAHGTKSAAHGTNSSAAAALQGQAGNCPQGLALTLDNGDAYEGGDTLQAFRALSEVRTHTQCSLGYTALVTEPTECELSAYSSYMGVHRIDLAQTDLAQTDLAPGDVKLANEIHDRRH